MKQIYRIIIIFSLLGIIPQLNAQIYSTADYSTSYRMESRMDYSQSATFRSTSSYRTSYEMPRGNFQANIQFANGSIQTAASSLSGATLADETGFIATSYNGVSGPQRSPGEGGSGVPDTPLGLGWDAILLMLLLAAGYIFYLRRKTTI